jgi:phage gpG-like protein
MNKLLRIEVKGQSELETKIRQLHEGLDTAKILDEGAALLFNRMRSRFLIESDPTGQRWPVSQAAIRRNRTGRGGGTLFNTGKLFRSLQIYATSGTTREIGTDVTAGGFPYGKVHQFGWGGLPRREFLGFGDEDVGLMSQLIIRRIVTSLSV